MRTSLTAPQRAAAAAAVTTSARRAAGAGATTPDALVFARRSHFSSSAAVAPPPPPSRTRTSATATAERGAPPAAAAASQFPQENTQQQQQQQNNNGTSKSDAAAVAAIVELVSSPAAGPRGAKGLPAEAARAFDAAVSALEASPRGVSDPASSPLLSGRWKLLFTTRPGSSSPIQRAFTGAGALGVHQEVTRAVASPRTGEVVVPGSVTNVVSLKGAGTLRVVAATSTAAAPLPGFTPRRGPGAPFLKFLGTSSVAPPRAPGERLDFAFRRAAFHVTGGVARGLSVPYPVPFETLSKIPGDLGDEVKGFLDTTYLSPDGGFRLSRGNKGTLFVLQREEGLKQRLIDAGRLGLTAAEVEAAAAELAASGAGEAAPARSPVALGRWRLAWSEQAPDAAPLQRALAGRVANWQVIGGADGRGEEGCEGGGGRAAAAATPLSNVVSLVPGLLDVVATATCRAASDSRTLVDIDGLELRTLGGRARLLRVDRTERTESDTGPALFPASRRTASGAERRDAAAAKTRAKTEAKKAGKAAKRKKNKEDNVGFVDWLFLDADVRVTRGSKGSLFVHTRDV